MKRMKRQEKIQRLQAALIEERLIYVRHKRDAKWARGFVVGMSEDWLLLHELERDTLQLNGYTALRIKDVAALSAATDFVNLALRLRGDGPVPQPDILLLDLPGLLSSVDAHCAPMRICQTGENGANYVGRLLNVTEKTVTLRSIDRDGRMTDAPRKIRRKDITRIDFGDGYATALWSVVEYRRGSGRRYEGK